MDHLTIREAADRAGCSAKTIRNRIKAGSLRAVKRDGKYGPEYRIPLPELLRLQEQPTLYAGQGSGSEAAGVEDPYPTDATVAGVVRELTAQMIEQAEELGRYRVLAERAESVEEERDRLVAERDGLRGQLATVEGALEAAMASPARRRWFGLGKRS